LFAKHFGRDEFGMTVQTNSITQEEAEDLIYDAAQNRGFVKELKKFIDDSGGGNNKVKLSLNQNQYDVLFSFYWNNGAYVFSDTAYISWISKGGENARRADARRELKDFL